MIEYELIDSGNLKKLEKFGSNTISRPCPQAIWHEKKLDLWNKADFVFLRDSKSEWINKNKKNTSWVIKLDDLKLVLKLTDFGHVGFFPEHLFLCEKLSEFIKQQNKKSNILNLFAYTGLASLFALKNDAKVCHVDSSKPTISWAKENIQINNFQAKEIRFIQDDVMKFIKREEKRGSKYDGIILDPPSFGRGAKNEVFKIENDIFELLSICKKLLLDENSFIIFSCHTPGFTKIVLKNFFLDLFKEEKFLKIDELLINPKNGYSIPSGFYVIWKKNGI
jgi:23S rRNA (cytosine1962-C5)-methyltransferase